MPDMMDIVQIKHEVLKTTAKHAFAGDLYESFDAIPFEIIQGIRPNFRCCVYREREIVRQRVRMAMGKLPHDVLYTDADASQVVHVIPCACEGCPHHQNHRHPELPELPGQEMRQGLPLRRHYQHAPGRRHRPGQVPQMRQVRGRLPLQRHRGNRAAL